MRPGTAEGMRSSRLLLLVLGAVTALVVLPGMASAQCAVCKSALVNSPEGQQLVSGFNHGILFLLTAPFVIAGAMAVVILKPAPAALFGANLWAGVRSAVRIGLALPMMGTSSNMGEQSATSPDPCSQGAAMGAPEASRTRRCRGCGAGLSERHIILRKTQDHERAEGISALYNCPACGLRWEAVPDFEDLRAWATLATGAALQAQGRFQEALACFEWVLAINASTAMGWHNRGCVLGSLGRWEEAIGSYNRALELDPDYADAWHNKAHALRTLRQFPAALECYRRALFLNPQRAITWLNTGDLLLALNRPDEARDCYDRVLPGEPRSARAWFGKGCAMAQLRRMDEALECFDRALAIDPQDAEVWRSKGNALCALGRFEEAMLCYEQALAIDPQEATAKHNRRALLRALRRVQ